MGTNSLSAAAITANLKTRLVGQLVLYYPRVSSTMEIARQEAKNGAAEGTVIIAGEQTEGKGRLHRSWLTPKGNIALSVIFYPSFAHLPSLIMLASLAVVHSIRTVTGLDPVVKWPNDVLLNSRKVCGILIENEVQKDAVGYAIIGVGLNVSLRTNEYPDMRDIATSLSQETGHDVSMVSVVRALLVELERLYLELTAGRSLVEEWSRNLATLGKPVRVHAGKTVYEGIAESVSPAGSLLLREAGGRLINIVAGDVTLRE